MTSNVDLERHLEDAERLLGAALRAVGEGQHPVRRTTDLTEDGAPALEVGDGLAALEPVPTEVRLGLGNVLRQRVVWRVWREVDDSDDSVGLSGSVLAPAEPLVQSSRAAWGVHEDCYTNLTDAVRHITYDLMDRRTDVAMETAGYDLAIARGEL